LGLLSLQALGGAPLSTHAAQQKSPAAKTPAAIEGNIDDVARAILTYFPKVTGKIVSQKGKEIIVDLGGKRGLSKGTLLTVFRKKESFHHPLTIPSSYHPINCGRF